MMCLAIKLWNNVLNAGIAVFKQGSTVYHHDTPISGGARREFMNMSFQICGPLNHLILIRLHTSSRSLPRWWPNVILTSGRQPAWTEYRTLKPTIMRICHRGGSFVYSVNHIRGFKVEHIKKKWLFELIILCIFILWNILNF